MKVRPKLKRIVGLTGTPASNGLMDLFAEFKLLDMGERLGRLIGQYRNTYFQPDKRNGMVIYSYKPLPDAEQRIYDKISDITISMKATDHLIMPELLCTEYTVQLSDKEREKYDRMKKDLELYQQTNARLWRQGQTADTVVIQHIIAKGTIDEQIMKALKTKDTTQAALITAVKAEVHK